MSQTAFVFPGQGSQFVGMGKDLYENYPSVQRLYEKASDTLGFDLTKICFEGPEEKLKQTQYTQPALYVHSAAMAELLKQKGVEASATAGHSLGEYSALAYAGVYSFEDGLKLVQSRAELMQEAAARNPGTMAAIIGLDTGDVIAICEESSQAGMVQPANFNSPGQIVISGTREGIEAAVRLAQEKGAKRALPLPVSGAFHSPLMQSAGDAIQDVLTTVSFSKSRIPVWTNVTAEAEQEPDVFQNLLVKQLAHPVRWIETVENMIGSGITQFVEVGPSKVLSGLIRRINREVNVIPCGTVEDLDELS